MGMPRDQETKFDSKRREQDLPAVDAAAVSQACDFLSQAKVKKCDLLTNGSNYVFLATLAKDQLQVKAIYKPRRGEIPLWDFPDGTLYQREYAAFRVSQELGWPLIPPTVIREGPHGIGSMQWFVETVSWAKPQFSVEDSDLLKQVALFDILVNNADRKAGHFLQGKDGRLWLVDHGLTFNVQPKLRTVLWDFSGENIPEALLKDLKAFGDRLTRERRLRDALLRHLNESEVTALMARIKAILAKPVFASPSSVRSVPWPWF